MAPESRAIGIADVAKLAGVSVSTVSYVLNNRGNISQATADRVREAAEVLQYVPNARARTLVRGVSDTLGVWLPEALAGDAFPTSLFSGLMAASLDRHYHLMLLSPPPEAPGAYIHTLVRSGRVDGLILLDNSDPTIQQELSTVSRVPIVVYGALAEDGGAYTTDWLADAHTALQCLITLGHQHIVYLHNVRQSDAKRHAMERAMRGSAVHGFTLPLDPGDEESPNEILSVMSPASSRPSAILTDSLMLAEIAEATCRAAGINLPRDVSILAVDLGWRRPPMTRSLTTVSPNLRAVGYALATGVINAITEADSPPPMLTGELQIRSSTGIRALYSTPRTDPAEPVLKAGHTFAIFAADGNMTPASARQGIYLHDTRLVSQYDWHIDQEAALSPVRQIVNANRIESSYVCQHTGLTRVLHRVTTLYPDRLEDAWQWSHYGSAEPWTLTTSFDADFVDIFALRGTPYSQRGRIARTTESNQISFFYTGLDQVNRSVRVSASKIPTNTHPGRFTWDIPQEFRDGALTLTIRWENPVPEAAGLPASPIDRGTPLTLVHNTWNAVLKRSQEDFSLLLSDFGQGPVPMAGLPWFGTFFGRDAILSSYAWLTWHPEVARSTLYTLAHYQGTTIDPAREEEPGKMLHELRWGEMAGAGQVPFSRYYGSVDVTPLFLMLLIDTWQRTPDDKMMDELWPHAEAALTWLLAQQDPKTKLFSFAPRSPQGLVIQSWKDSFDSMVYHDGHHAEPPLAVAEVQGYAYGALHRMAQYYRYRKDMPQARRLESRAAQLKKAFNQRFWLESHSYYALALDRQGHPLDVITSDPGHCLWTDIIETSHQPAVAKTLMGSGLFSGWGIRTLSADELAYDPYSYHRGSVWPHDTAMAAVGLARSGHWSQARQLAEALFNAAHLMPHHRLPELFSGEESLQGPLPYPEACSPQAWAASAPIWLLTVLTGITIDGVAKVIHYNRTPDTMPLDGIFKAVPLDDEVVTLAFKEGVLTVDPLPQGWTVRSHKK